MVHITFAHSICVHPDDSTRVAVAISCGGVWQTRDRGETWEVTAHLPPVYCLRFA